MKRQYHRAPPTLCALALTAFLAHAADPAPPKGTPAPAAPEANAAPIAAPIAAAAPAQLYVCTYGRSKFPENFAFQDGRKDASVDLAWSFYVARSGSEVTLIDTGFSAPVIAKQWYVTHTRTPTELLADLKITPDQVTRILITHIHFDHISDLPLYPRAQIIISRRSRDDYLSGKPLGGVMFDPLITAILKDPARTHVVDTRETLPGGLDFEVIGGHTAGSAVVHLQHAGVHHVLAGDECYLCANATQQRPIGRTFNPPLNLALLHRLADPAIVVLPCHDLTLLTRYPAVTPNIARIFGE